MARVGSECIFLWEVEYVALAVCWLWGDTGLGKGHCCLFDLYRCQLWVLGYCTPRSHPSWVDVPYRVNEPGESGPDIPAVVRRHLPGNVTSNADRNNWSFCLCAFRSLRIFSFFEYQHGADCWSTFFHIADLLFFTFFNIIFFALSLGITSDSQRRDRMM